MEQRGYPLRAGTLPIITPAFNLPSEYVIHVTGPQIPKGGSPTETSRDLLASAYRGSLQQCADNGIRRIAFCGISTGLFGFPKDEASSIAVATVLEWIRAHPEQQLDLVVFNVFSDHEEALYRGKLANLHTTHHNVGQNAVVSRPSSQTSIRSKTLRLAKKWIGQADTVLICAGAGMSVKEGEMVYSNPADFAHYYPWFSKWGYKTSYQVMGLGYDPRVPMAAKWAMWAKHMHLQRWEFEPNDGYQTLLNMVKDKDFFVLTSNVDACFERSGFAKERIYTPQGEWTYYQCKQACRTDAIFESRPMLDEVVPHISSDGFVPEHLIPKCKFCGGEVFGNVRSDGNFLHQKYEAQNDALRRWMQKHGNDPNRTIAIIEIGAGFNTPTVTRFPIESYAKQLDSRGHLIRINPTDPEVPLGLKNALSISEGWKVLKDIELSLPSETKECDEQEVMNHQTAIQATSDDEQSIQWARYLSHFDWNTMLKQLKDNN
jgi:O-acetyl-ADP-ribose deacetylase (regulator of RNase III)/NAD-dependent SIR2 family protein deacetylase